MCVFVSYTLALNFLFHKPPCVYAFASTACMKKWLSSLSLLLTLAGRAVGVGLGGWVGGWFGLVFFSVFLVTDKFPTPLLLVLLCMYVYGP